MGITFRRRHGQSKWHYCQNCSEWPQSDYETHESPRDGETCRECHALDRSGGCRYLPDETQEEKTAPDPPD